MIKDLLGTIEKVINERRSSIYTMENLYLDLVASNLIGRGVLSEGLLCSHGIVCGEVFDYKERDELLAQISEMDIDAIVAHADRFIENDQRISSGSYYTDQTTANMMIVRALMDYFGENETFSSDFLLSVLLMQETESYDESEIIRFFVVLRELTVMDSACGSGIFIFNYLKYCHELLCSHEEVLSRYGLATGDYMKYLIECSVTGVDIQAYPLKIGKIAILSYFNEIADSLEAIGLMQSDTLNDEFLELPRIKSQLERGGFHIVFGNPPYLGEKGNKGLFDDLKDSQLGQAYYEGKMDLYYFFIHRAIGVLKPGGVLTYITTNYFTTADGGKKLRQRLKGNGRFSRFYLYDHFKLFKEAAGQHNLIFSYILDGGKDSYVKGDYGDVFVTDVKKAVDWREPWLYANQSYDSDAMKVFAITRSRLYGESGNINLRVGVAEAGLLQKIEGKTTLTLSELCSVNQGIVSGCDIASKSVVQKKLGLSYSKAQGIEIGDGIFVLNQGEIEAVDPMLAYGKPFYKNSHIRKYKVADHTDKWLLYMTDDNDGFGEETPVYQHLLKYKPLLEKRREVANNMRKWHSLQWYRDETIFNGEKIVVPQRSKTNTFAYSDQPFYCSADVYYINLKEKSTEVLYYLLGVLNSKLYYFWLFYMGKRKGMALELYATPLKSIPIIEYRSASWQNEIIEHVRAILETETDYVEKERVIDDIINRAYLLDEEEVEMIERL